MQSPAASTQLAEQVLAQLGQHGLAVTPRTFEVWHAFLTRSEPALASVIDERLRSGAAVTEAWLEELHASHLRDDRSAKVAERSSKAVLMEIDRIVDVIRTSLGSSSRYGAALEQMLDGVAKANDPVAVQQVLTTLLSATQEARSSNEKLEQNLQAARNEVSELKGVLETVRQETLRDALTGVSNRRHFEQRLQAALEEAAASRQPFSLLMVDIDHFKRFNDQHGHLVGDKVLRVVAQALNGKFNSAATVARYGGEEFAVILPGADMMAGWVAAEAARQTIASREIIKRSTGESLGRITTTIGVGCWRRGDTAMSLISRADAALMRGKAFGRNRTVTEDQAVASAVA
jgi:diguanylate cyclase